MKALVYEGPRELHMREIPLPELAIDEVLVRVAFSGICGSELSGYLGHNSLRKPPLVMGHEFSGEIAALGDLALHHNPTLHIGQRVTANPLSYCGNCRNCLNGRQNLCARRQLLGAHRPGSYAEFVAVPVRLIYPLPDNLSLEHAALAEPLACALHAAQISRCDPADRALVIGLGPIGLLSIQVLQAYGVRHILASDTDPDRRAMAQALGVTALNPNEVDVVRVIHEHTDNLGVDLVIEAVGATVTRRQGVEAVATGGRVVLIGLHEEESVIPINVVIRREIELFGSFSYTPNNVAQALDWLAAKQISIDPWLVKAPLDEGPVWFERLLSGPGSVAKVLLH